MWKAEKVKTKPFEVFRPKSRFYRKKEDQFGIFFFKWSTIRPRSDKADLLGSTYNVNAIDFITVAKCKMYWHGVKSIALVLKGQSLSLTFYSHAMHFTFCNCNKMYSTYNIKPYNL